MRRCLGEVEAAELDANRVIEGCFGSTPTVTKDQPKPPRDLHFTEAQAGTEQGSQPVMGTPRGATGNDLTQGSK